MKVCDCTIGKVVYISETSTELCPIQETYKNLNDSIIKFELVGHIIGLTINSFGATIIKVQTNHPDNNKNIKVIHPNLLIDAKKWDEK